MAKCWLSGAQATAEMPVQALSSSRLAVFAPVTLVT
jgi:hypothetical protein